MITMQQLIEGNIAIYDDDSDYSCIYEDKYVNGGVSEYM